MSPFQIHVLGVGDTFSEVHAPSALLLGAEGFLLAIDCPDMYRRLLRQATHGTVELERIDDVLLTHVHGDHMNGLEGVGFFKRFKEGKRIRVHAVPEVLEGLWVHRLRSSMGRLWTGEEHQEMHFEDYFEGRPLSWQGATRIGPFEVEVRPTRHHVPTCALKVSHQGRMLGYSSDTAFDRELLDWLSDADLIIHETNLGPAHTPASELRALPPSLRHKLRLIHYPDGLELQSVPIQALHEGDVLKIEKNREPSP